MNKWTWTKKHRVLAALIRIGWIVKRDTSSHKVLTRGGWVDTFLGHEGEEMGPCMLTRFASCTGLRPEDL